MYNFRDFEPFITGGEDKDNVHINDADIGLMEFYVDFFA